MKLRPQLSPISTIQDPRSSSRSNSRSDSVSETRTAWLRTVAYYGRSGHSQSYLCIPPLWGRGMSKMFKLSITLYISLSFTLPLNICLPLVVCHWLMPLAHFFIPIKPIFIDICLLLWKMKQLVCKQKILSLFMPFNGNFHTKYELILIYFDLLVTLKISKKSIGLVFFSILY